MSDSSSVGMIDAVQDLEKPHPHSIVKGTNQEREVAEPTISRACRASALVISNPPTLINIIRPLGGRRPAAVAAASPGSSTFAAK